MGTITNTDNNPDFTYGLLYYRQAETCTVWSFSRSVYCIYIQDRLI